MIKLGKINTLKVAKISANTVFVDVEKHGEIVLSGKDIKQSYAVGDELDVFVYCDGKGRILATVQNPLAQAGQVAWLKVVSLSHAGAFMHWGLDKDLLVPFSEQTQKMIEGEYYLVYVFLDDEDRIVATTFLNDYIEDEAFYLKEGQQVDLIIAGETELGIKAIVNHKFWGILYKNELFQKVKKGQSIKGFIKKIRNDKKIDLTLDQHKYADKVDLVTQRILSKLQQQGGEMVITDKSPPQVIYDAFGVSKKIFKQAVGTLYKQRKIVFDKHSIKLNDQHSSDRS